VKFKTSNDPIALLKRLAEIGAEPDLSDASTLSEILNNADLYMLHRAELLARSARPPAPAAPPVTPAPASIEEAVDVVAARKAAADFQATIRDPERYLARRDELLGKKPKP
jgi:hypothetical protein